MTSFARSGKPKREISLHFWLSDFFLAMRGTKIGRSFFSIPSNKLTKHLLLCQVPAMLLKYMSNTKLKFYFESLPLKDTPDTITMSIRVPAGNKGNTETVTSREN